MWVCPKTHLQRHVKASPAQGEPGTRGGGAHAPRTRPNGEGSPAPPSCLVADTLPLMRQAHAQLSVEEPARSRFTRTGTDAVPRSFVC